MKKLIPIIAIWSIIITANAQNAPVVLCSQPHEVDSSFSVVPFVGGTAPDYRMDDGCYQVSLPFNFCFYGTIYTSVYININGTILLGNDDLYPSANFPNNFNKEICAFLGDVDTRGALSGLVYYKLTPTALYVRWNKVAYFSQDDKLNDFELIITNGNDAVLPANHNIGFLYGNMEWAIGATTSDNNYGFYGYWPAQVALNKGDGVAYQLIGKFNNPTGNYDGPLLTNDGIQWLDNKAIYWNGCSNQPTPLINSLYPCDTVTICIGDTTQFDFYVETGGQSVTATVNPTNINVITIVSDNNNPQKITTQITDNGVEGYTTLNYSLTNSSGTSNHSVAVKAVNNASPTITIAGNAFYCGNTTILAVPDSFYSYYWSPPGYLMPDTIVTDSVGEYFVIVTDSNGCKTKSQSIMVTNAPSLVDSIIQPWAICEGESAVVTIVSTADSIYWQDTTLSGFEIHFVGGEQFYNAVLYNLQTGCVEEFTYDVPLAFCDGINENTLANTIKLYPNPATDNLVWNATGNVSNGAIQIFNAMGQMVFSKSTAGATEIISVTGLAEGIYYLKTILKEGVITKAFVKIAE